MNSAGVVYSGTPFTRVACGTVLIAACIVIAGADTVRACRSSEEQSLIMSRWLQSVSALINFVLDPASLDLHDDPMGTLRFLI